MQHTVKAQVRVIIFNTQVEVRLYFFNLGLKLKDLNNLSVIRTWSNVFIYTILYNNINFLFIFLRKNIKAFFKILKNVQIYVYFLYFIDILKFYHFYYLIFI